MSRRRAFIGSTTLDLPEHRAAAVAACERVGVEPVTLEYRAATDADPLALSAAQLDQADVYIGIVGFRYGFVPPGQDRSLTEIEFDRAGEIGIPRLLFLMSEEHPVRPGDVETGPGAEKLRLFKAAVRREIIVSEFRSPDELKAAVITGLVEVLQDRNRAARPTTALLLLPPDAEYRSLEAFLLIELERHGVRVLRPDRFLPSGAMWANALDDAIRRSDLVIADVTNPNPNMWFELGYVQALKKPTIFLAEAEALRVLPSDLQGFQLLTYETIHLGQLSKPLQHLLRAYAGEARR